MSPHRACHVTIVRTLVVVFSLMNIYIKTFDNAQEWIATGVSLFAVADSTFAGKEVVVSPEVWMVSIIAE